MRSSATIAIRRIRSILNIQVGLLGRIRFHPLFLALLLVAVGVGMWRDMVTLFILIMLHEIGHATAANYLGYEVQEVSLLPFGGVAKLSFGTVGFQPRHEAMIAIAGPFVNLVLVAVAWLCHALGIWSEAFYHTVVQLNLWIAVFNLLPGLPLDGGRVFRAARSRRVGYENATREAYHLAMFLSIALLVISGIALWSGYPHFGTLVLGIFLCVAAWTGSRDVRMETVRFLDSKRRQGLRQPEPVRALAARSTMTVNEVVRQFAPDRYHMVYVLNTDGMVLTILEEDELLDAVFSGRWMDTLDTWTNRP